MTGARFQDVEIDFLKSLKETYNDNKIPIIIVYTKAIMKSSFKKMEIYIKENIEDLKDEIFIPVLALESELINGQKVHPFGLIKLWKQTIQKCKKALDGDMKSFMTKNIARDIVSKIKDANIQIMDKIRENNIICFSENYLENKEDKDFEKFIINLFNENIKLFLEKTGVEDESIKIFETKLLKTMENFRNYYQEITKETIDKILEEKSNELLNVQVEVEQENKKNISVENKIILKNLKKV